VVLSYADYVTVMIGDACTFGGMQETSAASLISGENATLIISSFSTDFDDFEFGFEAGDLKDDYWALAGAAMCGSVIAMETVVYTFDDGTGPIVVAKPAWLDENALTVSSNGQQATTADVGSWTVTTNAYLEDYPIVEDDFTVAEFSVLEWTCLSPTGVRSISQLSTVYAYTYEYERTIVGPSIYVDGVDCTADLLSSFTAVHDEELIIYDDVNNEFTYIRDDG
jgi:hypothetical protein